MAARRKSGTKKDRALFRIPDFMKSAERTSKSSALTPHNWTIATLVAAMLGAGSSHLGLPWWALATVCIALLGVIGSFMWTSRHFALNSPDNLRSEKYLLDKLALEKSLVGDKDQGLQPVDEIDEEDAIDVGSVEKKTPQELP